MKNQFVPYELALKLKELGFDEECLSRYIIITKWEEPTGEIKLQLFLDASIEDKNLIKAPLWQQAFDWFRRKFNLEGSFGTTKFNTSFEKPTYGYNITNIGKDIKNRYVNQSRLIASYEEARQSCLEKLIELCQKESNYEKI